MSNKTYFCERLSTLVVVEEKLKKTSFLGKNMFRCRIKGQGDLYSIDLASDELSKSINVVISKINDR
jgi:hypothetical protein